jgi:DNA-binding MarR family transcriptional regulator
MVAHRDVRAVQSGYPQIYLACHIRHQRRASSAARLSPNDSMILSHLDERRAMRAGELARHLGVAASTMSAVVKRLASLGYIVRGRDGADGRAAGLRLSPAGARAMQDGSVLDTGRVAAMLSRLKPGERSRAVEGLALLARASRAINPETGEPR